MLSCSNIISDYVVFQAKKWPISCPVTKKKCCRQECLCVNEIAVNFFSCTVDTLEDSHILNLSQRITSEQELRDLGTKVLKVPEHIIDTALYNHRTSINDAAHDVLCTWLKDQPAKLEAYMNLQAGLKRAHMNQLATQLRMWVQGTEDVSQISDESMLLT